jgi:hypothetical protein
MSARKWHESKAMKGVNKKILKSMIGGDVKISEMREKYGRYVAMAVAQRRTLVDCDRFREDAERAVEVCRKGCSSGPWGWKDPRNSLTLPFWLQVFPGARVLIVHRKWRRGMAWSTPSGKFFAVSTRQVRMVHRYPIALNFFRHTRVLHVKFENLVNRPEHFNRMLSWVGLQPLSGAEHKALLKKTSYEKDGKKCR